LHQFGGWRNSGCQIPAGEVIDISWLFEEIRDELCRLYGRDGLMVNIWGGVPTWINIICGLAHERREQKLFYLKRGKMLNKCEGTSPKKSKTAANSKS
jgi:hypothetical protein